MFKQKTIKKIVCLEGVGVHSGKRSKVTFKPAAANTGIILQNQQFPDEKIKIGTIIPEVAIHATVVRQQNWGVSTIEHMMAAISALGIDNLIIDIFGVEIPILDGSALPFVQAFFETEIEECDCEKCFITPCEKLYFEEEERFIEIIPFEGNNVDAERMGLCFDHYVDFKHPLLGASNFSGVLDTSFFIREVAPARTFGFLSQLPMLRQHGLAKGTTLGNTVVVGEDEFLNSCRFENEFVRHKFLDLLGDLSLLGKNLVGTVKAKKTGHNFNHKVLEHFIKFPNKWKIL